MIAARTHAARVEALVRELARGAEWIEVEAGGSVLDGGELLRGAAHPRLARAQRELLRLHAAEFARLLAQASELRLGPAQVDGDALDAWRAALSDQRAAAALDGVRPARCVESAIAGCASDDVDRWCSAAELARASLALRPTLRATLALARDLMRDGRAERAAVVLARAWSSRPAFDTLRRSRELRALLAAALTRMGRSEAALLVRGAA
jgi:hypothetical protein